MDRFWAKSIPIPECGCIIWLGSVDKDGYGIFQKNNKRHKSHRFAWASENGPIPAKKGVLHRCDTPSCVNPHHLFLGTQKDNMRDMKQKNRARFGEHATKVKISREAAQDIRTSRQPLKELASKYNIHYQTAYRIRRGILWGHL